MSSHPFQRSFVDPSDELIICRENPAKISVGKKIRQSIQQLIHIV